MSINTPSFVAAVEAIYAAAPDPSLWPRALQAMADAFGDVGAILLYRRDDGSFGYIVSPSLEGLLSDYGRGFIGPDLRAVRGKERGIFISRDVVSDHHIASAEEMDRHPYYQWLATHRLKYHVAGAISPDPTIEVAIAVQRAIDREPYAGHEFEAMARLCRHAENALRLSMRLFDAEMANLGLADALSRMAMGVFILDERRRVTFSNDAATRRLGDGLRIVGDCLTAVLRSDQDLLDDAIAAALSATPEAVVRAPPPIRIHRSEQERPSTAYVLPVRAPLDAMTARFLTRARVIVLIVDAVSGAPPDPALVRDLLGLTLGEARVAALVGSGRAPREAAEKLGIAEETARTMLKRVFAKVGVSRQSELASLLTRLVLR
jgi:DNA-binding CsgD family transcriptional regulator/PAS domain-containing protein